MRFTVALTLLVVVFSAQSVTAQEAAPMAVKPAAAPAEPQPVQGTVTGDKVNIRPAPETDSAYIYQVFRGDKLIILAKRGDWYRIKVPRYWRYWVNKKFLTIDGEKKTAVLTANRINLRAGPGSTFDITGQLNKGAKFLYVKEIEEYVCLKPVPEAEGWIFAKFVDVPATVRVETGPGPVTATRPTTRPAIVDKKAAKEFDALKAKIEADVKKKEGARDIVKLMQDLMALRKKTKDPFVRLKIQRLYDRYLGVARAEVRMRAHVARLERIKKKLAEIDKKYGAGTATQPALDVPKAFGRIEKLNIRAYRGVEYKLMQGDKATYLLKSDTVKLEELVGAEVKLWGTSSHPEHFPAGVNLLEVTKAEKAAGAPLPATKPTAEEKPPEKAAEKPASK